MRAAKAEMPGFIKPQLPTLKTKAPSEGYIHEVKYDGYRAQVHVGKGSPKIFTRNGHDWTKPFSAIAGAFKLKSQRIFDGEVVVIHEGRTNFSELQADLAKGRQNRMLFYAFDILFHNREDLRAKPQLYRKERLKELIDMLDPPVLYSEQLEGDGHELFEAAAQLNYEGIVSKRADAPYRSDGKEAWLKIKTVQMGKFPIVGFVKDPSGVAALYLGKEEGKELVYMGKVGTGWSRTVSSEIRKSSIPW
ncbi:RNA ligase family protein [Bradyrhizobium sp. RT5a]|uniref:ATP-dependent DNA ligase n=1 Tax=Bradyrhizobium sp. RT5a TaxID=3156380 RepID=UPI003390C4E4